MLFTNNNIHIIKSMRITELSHKKNIFNGIHSDKDDGGYKDTQIILSLLNKQHSNKKISRLHKITL